ncbi:MAG: TetR/AcrR family transcriptional regulator [Ilumatobacteraceae bacterium]
MRTIHPTKQLLLDTAISLIDEFGPQGFTVDNLLDASKISKGSLYHHFEDFHDVIEQAQVARFARFVDEDIVVLTVLLSTSTSREDLGQRFAEVVQSSAAPGRAEARADRASIVGLSRHSKKFADALAVEQQRLTDSLADLAREMQERGWIAKDLDVVVLATFVQAYSLGVVLNDVTEKPISVDRWATFIGRVLSQTL